eukprot:scaffold7567_cov167-Ochromonas_danica.AAC.11
MLRICWEGFAHPKADTQQIPVIFNHSSYNSPVRMMLSLILAFVAIYKVSALNFLAVGDWGGNDQPPYYTAAQWTSASAMNTIASTLGSDFILAVGDNFYYDGVTSDTSSRFQDTFENVYTGSALQKDWFVVAGNHVALSSIHMVAETHPLYFSPLPNMPRAHAASQWDWIENKLSTSTADYLLVVGHYPVYSVCEHGPTSTLVALLRPMLIKYGAHYISGHDHCMEHLVDDEGGVNYWLTGMGIECCYRASKALVVPKGYLKWHVSDENKPAGVTAGFTSFDLNKQGLTAVFYDQVGNALYTSPTVAPRSK